MDQTLEERLTFTRSIEKCTGTASPLLIFLRKFLIKLTTCVSWFYLCNIMFHTFSVFLFS